jgi:chloramphenicol O-acetyltransferase type A
VNLKDEPGRDDLLYITSIPWVSFTGITHPVHMNPVDSIPRISWGKYFEEYNKIKLPLSVQVHHALADGVHMGQYFNNLQEILNNPEKYLKENSKL